VRRWNAPSGFERNVVLLGLTSLLNDIGSEIIYPLLPTFLTSVLGGSVAAVGLIEGLADSTASLVKLGSGWLSDRLRRRKRLAVLGYALAAACRPLVAAATAPWHVLLIRFADRAGKGLRSAPRDALLAESSPPESWGRSFGLHRALDHLGAVIGPLLAFALIRILGESYRMVFALAAVPGALAVATIAAGVSEPPPLALPRASPTLRLRLPRRLRGFLIVLLIFSLGNSTDAFLLLRAQLLGVRVALLPILWMVLHVVKSATSVPCGSLSDRLGRRRVILLGWFVYAAVYLGFAAASGTLQAWLLFAAYGLFFGLTEGTEKALIADLIPADERGMAFGFYHLTVGVAALPASLLFGVVWDWRGPAAAFTMGAALAALAATGLTLQNDAAPGRGAARQPAKKLIRR
jgi:MFS family permease